jgi:hypothetical protein
MTDRADSNHNEIEQLKRDIFSENKAIAKSSANRLVEIGEVEIIDFFISLLKSDSPIIRNRAALALADIGDNKSLEPLLEAIFKGKNHNHNGTLVYALESVDCSNKLVEIFTILFYESYEAKMSAYSILGNQTFTFFNEDLLKIKAMSEDCIQHPEKCPDYHQTELINIQAMVNHFMTYLD